MQEIMVRGLRLAARGSIPNGVSHASHLRSNLLLLVFPDFFVVLSFVLPFVAGFLQTSLLIFM